MPAPAGGRSATGGPCGCTHQILAYTFITERLPDDPHRLGGELSGPYQGKRVAHLGTTRVVYRIDEAAHSLGASIRLRGAVSGVRGVFSAAHGGDGALMSPQSWESFDQQINWAG